MLVLLYLMTNTFWEVRDSMKRVYQPQLPIFKMSLWGFFFGFLIEWKPLKKIIKGNIKVNWLLVPAILLITVSFIPRLYWVLWFGMGTPFYIEMLTMAEIQMLLNVFSGILLVRSFSENIN
jgi:hypothetical protein